MSKVHTRKNALLLYGVADAEGPAEDVMIEILKVLRDMIACAVEDGWSYEMRLRLYRNFLFEDQYSVEGVRAYRSFLLGGRSLSGCEQMVSEPE